MISRVISDSVLDGGSTGGGVLTWEESQSHLALYAIVSSPLFIGNDVRDGQIQPRLLGLLKNAAMLKVNQAYTLDFAGDRIESQAVGRELWGKPLPGAEAAAVLFNRNGTTYKCMASSPIDCPCDDFANATSGEQSMTLKFASLGERGWLGKQVGDVDIGLATGLSCEVTDVYGNGGAGAVSLGRFTGSWTAVVPPHGVRFLLVGNCTTAIRTDG